MKTIHFLKGWLPGLVLTISFFGLTGQDLSGAWRLTSQDGKKVTEECIKIYSDTYFMYGTHSSDGAFLNAGGGKYSINGKDYKEVPDFNTSDSTLVRRPVVYSFSLKGDQLTITSQSKEQTWTKVDSGKGELCGAWRFGARVNDAGEPGERRGAGSPRQTMKILSGKYFQWAAFNYETKEFSGTGGGTYQRKDNQYTETIRFFSRDNSRVGMSLTFECRVDGTDWFHKGKGTTGKPVSEVWERARF